MNNYFYFPYNYKLCVCVYFIFCLESKVGRQGFSELRPRLGAAGHDM